MKIPAWLPSHVRRLVWLSSRAPNLLILQRNFSSLRFNLKYVATLEKDGEVTFLHKIVDGPADKSYGIHVAKIAGLPADLLERADTILTQLEGETVTIQPQEKVSPQEKPATEKHVNEQISLFDDFTENPVLQELRDLDIYNMTPMQVMMAVADLKQKL